MVSLETQARIIKIFICIANYEKRIDKLRHLICNQVEFDPQLIFTRLDRECKLYIDDIDIKFFLK